MAAGFGVTAATIWVLMQSPELLIGLATSGLHWIAYGVVLLMAFFLPGRIPSMSRGAALAAFMLFAAAMGVSISSIALIYSVAEMGTALLGTIGMFGAMAVFGYVTKKDLSGMGQFLVMALFGAIIASLLNVFLIGSVGMSLGISALVAVVAAGLTAYHTQAIKQLYMMHGGQGNLAVLGALLLYVNFINIFLSLLHLLGGSRD